MKHLGNFINIPHTTTGPGLLTRLREMPDDSARVDPVSGKMA